MSAQDSKKTTQERRPRVGPLVGSLSFLLLPLFLLVSQHPIVPSVSATKTAADQAAASAHYSQQVDQFIRRNLNSNQQQPLAAAANFDISQHKSLLEAIQAHPELREFASLCESKGVREIVGMDKLALTVFAPTDRALHDLRRKSRPSINLIELAKQHIVQGFVMPDETIRSPLQLNSYAMLSPIYLSSSQQANSKQQQQQQQWFVNNAKILASYLIPIDQENNYQTLHLIDRPLEFAYVQRRTQIRQQQAGPAGSLAGAGSQSLLAGGAGRFASVRRPLALDEFASSPEAGEQAQALHEFQERFADLSAGDPQVDLYQARGLVRAATEPARRAPLVARDQLNLERLLASRSLRQAAAAGGRLRGRLFNANESANTYNTYFLPVAGDELDGLLADDSLLRQQLALEAHIIPNQALFTRQMPLGSPFETLLSQPGGSRPERVTLSLAKTIPSAGPTSADSSPADHHQAAAANFSSLAPSEQSRRLLAAPLLLQAQCDDQCSSGGLFRAGLTSAEILVANIPLSNGVLHLIQRPLLVTDSVNLLDYVNDNDNQLSQLASALGSRTRDISSSASSDQDDDDDHDDADASLGLGLGLDAPGDVDTTPLLRRSLRLGRFRELLARERQILSTMSAPAADQANRTILAPTDQAFARLRFDLRALVEGDDSLVPKHWDPSYRQDLLERLVKRHLIVQSSLTLSQLMEQQQPLVSSSGQQLVFTGPNSVECDGSRARVIERDLVGSNGMLHLIDRVLGEEQETVHSCIQANILMRQQQPSAGPSQLIQDLNQLVEANLKQMQPALQTTDQPQQQLDAELNNDLQARQQQPQQPKSSPELELISKTIGQFLEELAPAGRQSLGASVNVSYQLARLISTNAVSRQQLAGGSLDWNARLKGPQKFTYFMPSDLAWLRLQQLRPEFYRPLNYYLQQQPQQLAEAGGNQDAAASEQQQQVDPVAPPVPTSRRPSESSQRFLQILERHLLINRALKPRQLDQLESIRTLGATLRLTTSEPAFNSDQPGQQQQQQQATSSTFAALHSILGDNLPSGGHHQQPPAGGPHRRALRLAANSINQANIVQVNETSNGFLYIIDQVLVTPEDSDYVTQTSSTPAVGSSMASLFGVGAHQSIILDSILNLLAPSSLNNLSTGSLLALIGFLTAAILVLVLLTLGLIVRRRRQNKLNQHRQLESGLTSASSNNSGSTSTTKSL